MFYRDSSSPFVYDGLFNFQQYVNDNNIGNIDVVVFFLGMNDGNPLFVEKMAWGGIDVPSCITDVFPNVKIVISGVPPYWGHFNHSLNNRAVGQYSRILYNKRTFDFIKNHTNVNISLTNGFHRIYGYRSSVEQRNNQFPNGTIAGDVELPTTALFNYDHHPSTFGCEVIAYCLYNAIFIQ